MYCQYYKPMKSTLISHTYKMVSFSMTLRAEVEGNAELESSNENVLDYTELLSKEKGWSSNDDNDQAL